MLKKTDYITARNLLLQTAQTVEPETVDLWDAFGRIIAEDVLASENVPPFDRSPYDGYAFRSADSLEASSDHPVTLRVIEEVPAGSVPTLPCVPGTAVKVLTGAPIPEGADAVVMYEKTEFTETEVKLFSPAKSGSNIIRAGEDVRKGETLIRKGMRLDAGALGTLASQGICRSLVFGRPKVGILSTGSEIVEPDVVPGPGQIPNSNRFTLMGALQKLGCEPVYLGLAGDSVERIAALFSDGLARCDAIVSTGGVSVGDYDLTPDAMERAGIRLLLQGVDIKPGMACAYGEAQGKLVCALSGNPASSLTNFYAVALPALRKLCGYEEPIPREIVVTLSGGFGKKSPSTRFLRGALAFSDGQALLRIPEDQGNVVLSSSIGCDAMAIVPAGSGPLADGTVLKGFEV